MNLVQAHGEGAPALEDCPSSSPAPGSLHVKGEAKDPEAAWGGWQSLSQMNSWVL